MTYHPNWLNRERASIYPKWIFAVLLTFTVAKIFLSNSMPDPKGGPLGFDFITFWGASHLGLTGHAGDAYDFNLLFHAEQIAAPTLEKPVPWFYPPSFYLIILPLALLPYIAAYTVFMVSTLTVYVLALQRIIKGNIAFWCLAAFPGLWLNLYVGQNAFLSASLAGMGLLCLKHKPVLAGVFIGLLAIKPHLALLFPIALIAIGAWRTFVAAAITACGFVGISTLVLGASTLNASLGSMRYAKIFLESGSLPWSKMPAVFVSLRQIGMSVSWAYFFHGVIAMGAVILVWRLWRQCLDWNIRGAALMTATFLISPYVFDYDLAWLAFPIAWMAAIGIRYGWLPWEREMLFAAWLFPLLMVNIDVALNFQMGAWVLIGLLWIIARRAASISADEINSVNVFIHSTPSTSRSI